MPAPQPKHEELYNRIIDWAAVQDTQPDEMTYQRWKNEIQQHCSSDEYHYYLSFCILEAINLNFEGSFKYYSTAMNKFSPNTNIYSSFFVTAGRLGNFSKEAFSRYDQALCLFPNHPDILRKMLIYVFRSGNLSKYRELTVHIHKVLGENSEFAKLISQQEEYMNDLLASGISEEGFQKLRGLVNGFLMSNDLHLIQERVKGVDFESPVIEFTVYPVLEFNRWYSLNDDLIDHIVEQWGDEGIDWMARLSVHIASGEVRAH